MAQVFHVLRRMDELGCDLFLDIHGDEEIAANFLAGSEGVPSWNEAMAALAKTFMTGCARGPAPLAQARPCTAGSIRQPTGGPHSPLPWPRRSGARGLRRLPKRSM